MPITNLIAAVVLAIIGIVTCFAGYRLFRFLIPIWGFIVGFFAVFNAMRDIFGTGFLPTAMGVALGIVLGILIALLAYSFYYVAIVALSLMFGYLLGIGIVNALGVKIGWVEVAVGVLVAINIALLVIYLDLPKTLIIFFSALDGAAVLITGALLALNQISLDNAENFDVRAYLNTSPIWLLAFIVLAILGLIVQFTATQRFTHPEHQHARGARGSRRSQQAAQSEQSAQPSQAAAQS